MIVSIAIVTQLELQQTDTVLDEDSFLDHVSLITSNAGSQPFEIN